MMIDSDKHPPTLIAVGDNCLDVNCDKKCLTVGGNALNVAVQWQQLGQQLGYKVRYFGALGQDDEANIMLCVLQEIGLNIQDIEILPGKSAVTLLSNEGGERRFLLETLGVGKNYYPESNRYQQLLTADFVHLGTNSNQKLVHQLVQDGVRFSLDLSTHHEALDIAGVELVFASGPENNLKSVDRLIEKFIAHGAKTILLTCGSHGAYYYDGTKITYMPARAIEVVDTCGAGDSFLACFVFALFFMGDNVQQALLKATHHAAQTCLHWGGFVQPALAIAPPLIEKYKLEQFALSEKRDWDKNCLKTKN